MIYSIITFFVLGGAVVCALTLGLHPIDSRDRRLARQWARAAFFCWAWPIFLVMIIVWLFKIAFNEDTNHRAEDAVKS